VPVELSSLLGQDIFLDGELWVGRGRYLSLLSVLSTKQSWTLMESNRDADSSVDIYNNRIWNVLRFIVFDNPSPSTLIEENRTTVFEIRYTTLYNSIDKVHPFITIAPRMVCKGKVHMKTHFDDVVSSRVGGEGEGVILRKPLSAYVNGRSDSLLKFKIWRDDEALVLEMRADHYICKLPNNIIILAKVEKSIDPISVGDVVSFKYSKITKTGVPIDPIIYRIRNELKWDDVLINAARLKHN